MAQDPDRCPRCQQPNRCAVAAGASGEFHCWCMNRTFPGAAVPGNGGAACLCQACLQLYRPDAKAASDTHMP